jgi:hypothetical protein
MHPATEFVSPSLVSFQMHKKKGSTVVTPPPGYCFFRDLLFVLVLIYAC